MEHESVVELWEKACRGDKSAEALIFEALRVRFAAIARLYVRREDVEDISQDACITVLQKYKDIGDPFEYNAWAIQVLKNKIRNFKRREGTSRRVFDGQSGGDIERSAPAPQDDYSIKKLLRDCLRLLTRTYPRYARVLNLIHHGYSTEEICRKINVSRNNLYVILARSRKILGNCLFEDNHQ